MIRTTYRKDLKAEVSVDHDKRVRHVRHNQEYWLSKQNIPRLTAKDYLHELADVFQIPKDQLKNLNKKVSFYDPRDQGIEYQLNEEKHLFDSTTMGYYQTFLNVPVWRKGLSVKIKQNPQRVVGATNNSEYGLSGKLPSQKAIDRYKQLFRVIAARKAAVDLGLGENEIAREGADQPVAFVRGLLNLTSPPPPSPAGANVADRTRILSGKFFIYKYDPDRRYAGKPSPTKPRPTSTPSTAAQRPVEEAEEVPIPELPPVPSTIKPGEAYLVAQIIFESNAAGFRGFVWLILVEVETGAILYIECMTCGIDGRVFRRDPQVKTGNVAILASDNTATLDMHRDNETLSDLDPPDGMTQHLRGTYVEIEELTIDHADPDVDPPTEGAGDDFDYHSRTNNFGAVNAYYHQTELFKRIEDLGFPIATYFDGTTFPIPVDHRALGDVINAHWWPNGVDGTAHLCFALCDTSNIGEPLARAVDPWVHWHEMGGHGVLGDHVGSGNLGFCHSVGDGLAAIQMDPDSGLRALPERFRYAPFRPFTATPNVVPLPGERRFDRDDVTQWAWGGDDFTDAGGNVIGDDGIYGSEQILATCHFRIYRSIGGDHPDLGRRQFASRVATYLVLRTIDGLTAATNPDDPQIWCEEMQDADLENWTSEGISGGAYNKVIRWAFEKQGCYQPMGGPGGPVTTEGDPPDVDVYIDDGRGGEYPFQHVHWHNASMWNRQGPDGLEGHQNAVEDETNYMWGKIKNRGTQQAHNVNVRCYHSLPGAGLTWPDDFTEMSPAGGLDLPNISPDSSEEVTVGPFEWVPNENVYGHDCVLMIVSADGDPSNIDNFTGGETVAEWRLVPNDNNVGQRNVSIVPGATGEALLAGLDGAPFFAGNNMNKLADMELRVELPRVLTARGWRVGFADLPNNRFQLKPGQKRRIQLSVTKGGAFTADDVRGSADKDIVVSLLGNGILLGGMTYRIDPDLAKPSGGKREPGDKCNAAASRLLDCLKVTGDAKVKKVCVKKVTVDIELDNDCC